MTSVTGRSRCGLLPRQGRLLSLLDDNTIHLWELVAGAPREVGGEKREGVVCLQEVGDYTLPGRPGIESCRCVQSLAGKLPRSAVQMCENALVVSNCVCITPRIVQNLNIARKKNANGNG